jgi:Fe-S cluster biogenesis protein NfuA/nitrite reductase/ring-hydroxylating ferredoxin subunit
LVSAVHDEVPQTVAAPPTLSVQQMADRVATLLAGFESVSTPRQARESAESLVQTIVTLYGNGIERILEIVHDTTGEGSEPVFAALVADKFVESLLCLHNLHPIALEERVQTALDSVRPYLESHEGGIDIVGIEDGVVLLRLEGSCDGCPSSAATVKLAVEKAILERVPEISEVRAVGLVPTLPTAATNGRATTLKVQSDWIPLEDMPGLAATPDEGLQARVVDGTPILFVRFGSTVYAYRNVCPGCSQTLENSRLARPVLTCSCGNAFDVVHAGRPAGGAVAAAEPFPLASENGRVRISIPLGV